MTAAPQPSRAFVIKPQRSAADRRRFLDAALFALRSRENRRQAVERVMMEDGISPAEAVMLVEAVMTENRQLNRRLGWKSLLVGLALLAIAAVMGAIGPAGSGAWWEPVGQAFDKMVLSALVLVGMGLLGCGFGLIQIVFPSPYKVMTVYSVDDFDFDWL